MAKVSNVSFLGPILEKTAFEMMLEKKPLPKRVLYGGIMRLDSVFLSIDEKKGAEFKFGDVAAAQKKTEVKMSSSDLFGDFKFIPPFRERGLRGASAPRMDQGERARDFAIEGALSEREVVIRPPSPPLVPKRIEAGQDSYTVGLKISVSSAGKVEDVVLSASSGYPDIDLAAINYIKGFYFSPVKGKDTLTWGKMSLNLKSS